MEKVSIIIPCYNDGKYLMQAIESVSNQTYGNKEVIVIDDGSNDLNTVKKISELKKRKDITVLKASHLGPSAARNYGIQKSNGKYILPLDADDVIEPSYVEKAVDILQQNKRIGVVYCFADQFGKKTGEWKLPAYSLAKMLVDNIVFVSALFYREDWERVGGFDVSMELGMEDYSFWLSILELGKEIYQIPEVLFHYRIKKQSRTTKYINDIEKVKQIYEKIYSVHKELYNNHSEEYVLALRDEWLNCMYTLRKYDKRFEKIRWMKKIPIVGKLIARG